MHSGMARSICREVANPGSDRSSNMSNSSEMNETSEIIGRPGPSGSAERPESGKLDSGQPDSGQQDSGQQDSGQIKSHERKPRVRRPADLLLALLALSVVGLLLGVAHGLPIGTRELTENVATWLTHHIPRGLAFFFVSGAGLGSAAFVVVATVSVLRSDARDARNALGAFIFGLAISSACAVGWQSRRGGVAAAMLGGTNASALVASVGFIAFLTSTDLARRPRWARWCVLIVVLLPVSELIAGDLTFLATLTAPLAGWAIGLILRWALAVASVMPGSERVRSWLEKSGIPVAFLEEGSDRHGFDGALEDGTSLSVILESRDTRGSGVARRLWRLLRFREVG